MIRFKICISLIILFSAVLFAFGQDRKYFITDFGAKGDSLFLNTLAIQTAIDKCSVQGGGTVIIPKGVFISGSVFLKEKVNLSIETGGVLKGSVNQNDYPQIDTRWEGEEKKWTACLLNAINLKEFKISGPGKIDGSGDVWTVQGRQMFQERKLKNLPVYGKPRLIGLQNCENAEISGLTLNNQASWGLFVLYSKEIKISNLLIRAAHNIPSSDGIDIDSSKDILVSGCDIDVNDDCISLKAGKDEDGLRVNRPCEDILIRKCRFGYGHGGVAMGSETSGGIRNVTVEDCIAEAGNWAPIRFKSQPSRGGVVENITYKNIRLKDTRKAFEFNMAWRMVDPKPAAKVLPVVRNVQLINITGTASSAGDIRGLADSPVRGVVFKNCSITAKKGFIIENARQVDLSGLKIWGAEGDAIVRINAD